MGLLTEGTPLSWQETKKWVDHVRRQGVLQFIKLFNKQRNRGDDVLKWGDETEYMIIKFDHEKKMARISLRSEEVLDHMNMLENLGNLSSLWRPEFGAYMVEAMPSKPYSGLICELNMVESNMRTRREEIKQALYQEESLMSLTSFPRLGCDEFMDPAIKVSLYENNKESIFFRGKTIICKHPKFGAMNRNIQDRRRKKVIINVPIYKDHKTLTPFLENLQDGKNEGLLKDHIYMDNLMFGMGCCSLQVTLQACNIREARILFDQLAVLSPIMMALSASSPVYRGYLSDTDCKWCTIVNSVDDRTDEERGVKPTTEDNVFINKARYSGVNSYLSPEGEMLNDVEVVFNKYVYKELRDAGIDHLLSQHVAHLFIREPLFLFSENICPQSEDDMYHYENIHSTNWQTVRLKVPSPDGSIGWRVEFRPMEVQLTDFENAAYAVFVMLLTRVILSLKLNFLIPISKVDENYEEAQKRDAVRSRTFWFQTNFMKDKNASEETCHSDGSYAKMTMNEIISGKDDSFPGLVPLIQKFLCSADVEVDTLHTLQKYLEFLQHRASGKLLTTAQWIREYVLDHPDYRQDSVVTQRINYDLLCTANRIQRGELKCPRLLGSS
ncbi:glutamate--cysteine ligase-like [Limulus polyphemus]|uniref:Glutamate--cysteine ligase n=1 Tax=Limulus polyphemus TaxID=6850 RepID=A0ABM1S6J1_LIMPO|nr:glutamate--cysteine ligase-like [Limulus polyphemus]